LLESFVSAGVIAGISALLAAIDLVYDYRGQARTHGDLRRKYYELLAELRSLPLPNHNDLLRLRSEIIRITSSEPTEYRAADAIAYNEACDTLGIKRDYQLYVPVRARLLRNLCPFYGMHFMTNAERAASLTATRPWWFF
jgi:hypothetical protein